jgi:heme/copper-type cytochrome/quinol oxidase subunit 1
MINMTDDLKEPQLRTLQYWTVDGVGELFVGLLFLLVAIVYYLQESTTGSLLSKVFGIVSVILVCGGAFGGRWIMQRVKERTTYPRTGYVAYKREKYSKGDVAIAVGVMTLILASPR